MISVEERYAAVLDWFEKNMPVAETELHFSNTYQLLVAVILSAQCTDKRVNMITPALFDAFPTAADMAGATVEEICGYIKSVTYPNNKARNLLAMAKMLTEVYNGEVPDTLDELLNIPGVGRKTANVIMAVAFNKPAMAVDTHVFRVSERIGLTSGSKTPLQTEQTLTAHIPESLLGKAHHWLILHGRYVCKARKPECLDCGLKNYCRYYSKE